MVCWRGWSTDIGAVPWVGAPTNDKMEPRHRNEAGSFKTWQGYLRAPMIKPSVCHCSSDLCLGCGFQPFHFDRFLGGQWCQCHLPSRSTTQVALPGRPGTADIFRRAGECVTKGGNAAALPPFRTREVWLQQILLSEHETRCQQYGLSHREKKACLAEMTRLETHIAIFAQSCVAGCLQVVFSMQLTKLRFLYNIYYIIN